ncbi:uncharacterized protein PV07_11462 [Cladophialophora immunda]|uniref:Uncharacterized protein n=1 Tax=Cladophialophora immunda TaxID=569365 RepID=A0A0D2BY36_9EURO|nr:uncharacterized protein PV07_11462 [Cladophialophora immunda]KIW23250.1 hypothetical protein PV07_11462 [Cladophialophora immunda]
MTDHPTNASDGDWEDSPQSPTANDRNHQEDWSRVCSRGTSVEPSGADAGDAPRPEHLDSNGNNDNISSEESEENMPPNRAASMEQDLLGIVPSPIGRQVLDATSQLTVSFETQTSDGPGLIGPEQSHEPEEQTECRDSGNSSKDHKRKAPPELDGTISQSPKRVCRCKE